MPVVLFTFGGRPFTVAEAAAVAAAVLALLLFLVLVSLVRQSRARAAVVAEEALRRDEMDRRLRELVRVQSETAGRVQSMTEILAQRQSELARAVSDRLDQTSHRLGETLSTAARATHESLTRIAERLVMVETAERTLGDLSAQVVSLRETLANKQARGAFGQARMEAIVADGLPRGSFAFQYTLSNGKRPDCAIFLPGDPRPLLVDSKFPLEAVTAFREAPSAEHRKAAGQRLRNDLLKHVYDVAERYFIPGETQDVALIFVPSESVYAEISEHFDGVVQEAYRLRVVLVSPSLLMLAVQVVQAIAKDARMREEADRVRAEVAALVDDVSRLRERVGDLAKHFSQVGDDVQRVIISADKIARRGLRLEQLDFDTPGPAPSAPPE
ncbi:MULTISPECIES: DNA recombination protein RmuC [unclassified Xanthobacter]|uniref:DNA recombination protein RmuC n=1 Tax=Xanthobacter TaxID=279 RepID=UPI00145E96BE|nr:MULTISPECIES: DNA recombination protein RmuC [unclassified Xanthobacter]NMN57708.1 DNA recombination protein RmuC [Xanthobacter sp. SG618]UJX47188.1 DNA recombination protein RmuC [Xanthobacter sp. YC-JY1]